MDENLSNIEDLFRYVLEDNEDTPSPQAWAGIDQALDKENIVSIKKKYTAMKRMAMLLLLLLFGFSMYEIANRYNAKVAIKENINEVNTRSITTDSQLTSEISAASLSKTYNDTKEGGTKKEPYAKTDFSISVTTDEKNNQHQSSLGDNTRLNSKPITKTDFNTTDKNKYLLNNRSVDNVKVDENLADNIDLLDNKVKQKAKLTLISNTKNTIAERMNAAANKPKFAVKGKHKFSIKNIKTTEAEQQAKVADSPADIIIPSRVQWQLIFLTIEKIRRQQSSIIDIKRLSQLLPAINSVSAIEINNKVAVKIKNNRFNPARVSINAFFSPDIAWYNLQDNNQDNQEGNVGEFEMNEKHKFSLTTGLLVDYRLNKHWVLQSGLTYSTTNIAGNAQTLYAQNDNTGDIKYRVNTSSGHGYVLPSFNINPAVGDSLFAFNSIHTIKYIGVPLSIKYYIAMDKFSFNIMAGLSTNFLTESKLQTSIENGFNSVDEVVYNLQGLKKLYTSALIGIGIDYTITKGIALSFAPTYRFALSSINQNTAVKSYPRSLGLAIGLKIGL